MNGKSKSASMLAVFFLLFALAGTARAQGGTTVIAEGFNGPQGVLVAPDGSVWVIDSGLGGDQEVAFVNPESGQEETAKIGETARVVRVAADGSQSVAATLPSILMGQEASGGARLALLGGTVYATSGGWLASAQPDGAPPKWAEVVKIADGQATEFAKTWPLEKDNNPDGHILESHPYGLIAGPDGMLYVADAGGNTLLKVDPASGQVSLLTVFPGVPGPLPNPNRGNALESDPVPTAVAFDSSGNIYVSYLPGFPFVPGSAKIVKVGADGAVSDYATGLTMITDLRTAPDGNMYAVQLGVFTDQGPQPNTGAIIRIKPGDTSEIVLSGLSFPSSIDFDAAGDAYIALNGVGAPGSGQLVKASGLTSAAGTGLVTAAAQPAALPTTGGLPFSGAWIALAAGLGLVATSLVVGRRLATERVRDK